MCPKSYSRALSSSGRKDSHADYVRFAGDVAAANGAEGGTQDEVIWRYLHDDHG